MNVSPPNSGVGGLVTGFSRLSKGLSIFLVIGYGVSVLAPFTVDFLALVPGKTIPFAWNLLTAGYFEQSIFTLIVSVLGLLLSGKVLEPIWGSREFFKFILIVNFLTFVATFALAICLYSTTTNEKYLYAPLSGFHGVLAGFLVAVKQLMPEQEITVLFVLKLRAKWLPSILVCMSVVVGILAKDAMTFCPFIIFGTYCSWLYLRFFQRQSEVNVKGDPSDEFSFRTFFPEILWPIVNPISVICDKLFCGRRSKTGEEGQGHILGGVPLPGSDPIEASRRRERGARALEERLSAAKVEDPVTNVEKKAGPIGSEDNV